jgi:malonyl-CoA/methylmalonyl-CoA synthetase
MTDANKTERTEPGPQDAGNIFLPNTLFFGKLLRLAQLSPTRVAIRDINLGIERTYLQLLIDVFALRNTIQGSLSPTALADLSFGKDIYIALLAPGGYEYAVGFFAILCLGAAVVPLCLYSRYTEPRAL